MYSVDSIIELMAKHSEIRDLQDFEGAKIIGKAYDLANEDGFIPIGKIKEILGNHAALFFEEASDGLLGQETMDLNKTSSKK